MLLDAVEEYTLRVEGPPGRVRRLRSDNEGGIMSSVTTARTAIWAVLLATFAVGSDKTPPMYQQNRGEEDDLRGR
jgi:hypothetical protein